MLKCKDLCSNYKMYNCLFYSIPYKIPVVNGVDIDLYLLYSLVIQKGGLSKVSIKKNILKETTHQFYLIFYLKYKILSNIIKLNIKINCS